MPIYEYKCKKCDTMFEELVTLSAPHVISCPSCHTGEVEKQMSAGAIGHSSGEKASCGAACPSASACASGGCCSQFS